MKFFPPALAFALALSGCHASAPAAKPTAPAARIPTAPAPVPAPKISAPVEKLPPVMLGIDVLEADGFALLTGKRLGLLTHPAGVNRRGERTADVLRRAPGVKLVALFGVEHGVNNEFSAGKNYESYTDRRTGLPVLSLYDGRSRKPTKAQLKGLDAVIVDLQDIGTRSYTFISAMKGAMEACFENGVEVIVLDRPNPLGGLKVDGPPMDAAQVSYVGAFRVPYVHGLTIAELAKLAKEAPGVLTVSEKIRAAGRLSVVPMRGWTRAMRWPETGLTWVPTSPRMKDFSAVVGYPMTGLGCELGGFKHGVGDQYDFRGILHLAAKLDVVEKELRALKLPGLQYRRVSVPNARSGQPGTGLFIEVADWDEWRPAELNFYLMRLACKLAPKSQNPFATAAAGPRSLFLHLLGTQAFFNELVAKGAQADVEAWLRQWREQAKVYQEQSKKYWLYR